MTIFLDVDAAITVPVNVAPLIDDTDFKSREVAIVYNQAGMDLVWNFITSAGTITQTAVTPTTAGVYDWTHIGDGMYKIEIPASAGGSINNDTEGYGWFSGICTGVLPWRGPTVGFRASGLNDLLIESAYSATRGLSGTALPAAAADAIGGLPISIAGGLDLDAKLANTNEITAARMSELDAAKLPADVDTLLARLTAGRAALLDNIPAGTMPTQAEVLSIQNNTRTTIGIPTVAERPDSGSTLLKIYLNNYDTIGNMEAPDSAPTVAVANEAGTTRDGNLQHPTTHVAQTALVNLSAGRYWIEYDLDNADALESLTFTFSIIEGGTTRVIDRVMLVVDTTAVDFTAADRTKLNTLHDTRLTAARAANLDEITAARLSELDDAAGKLVNDVAAVLLTRIPGVVAAQTGDAFARLAAYRLGELLSAALASQPFAASLLADLTEDNAGTQRFTTPALAQAPGGGNVTVGDLTAAALAKFMTTDTGETVAVAGSVGKIAQGSAGGSVDVASFSGAANTKVDAIKAKTDTIGATTVTVTSPIALDQNLTLVKGDDYKAADGRALDFVNAAGTWPDLTGATINFKATNSRSPAQSFGESTGAVIVAVGVGQQVRIEIAASATAALDAGSYEFDVEATLANTNVVTLVSSEGKHDVELTLLGSHAP